MGQFKIKNLKKYLNGNILTAAALMIIFLSITSWLAFQVKSGAIDLNPPLSLLTTLPKQEGVSQTVIEPTVSAGELQIAPGNPPVAASLISEPASFAGTVSALAVGGDSLTLKSENGSERSFFLQEETQYFEILTSASGVVLNPVQTRQISVSQISPGDRASVYLESEDQVLAVFTIKQR